jgi:type IV pilus assembly protein PilY1
MRILAGAALALGLATPAGAIGDLDLLANANVPPNVMIMLDNSGSMAFANGTSTRTEVARDAVLDLIDGLYPDDGSGGYTATVRLGLTSFNSTSSGANVRVGIASNNKQDLIDETNAITNSVLSGGGTWTPLSETLVDIGRYFAGQHGFGFYPDYGNTSPIDLECRENFVVIVTDGEPTHDQNNHHGSWVFGTSAYSDFKNTIGNTDGDSNECAALATACIDDPEGGRDDGLVYTDEGTDWLDDVAWYLANTDLVPDASLAGDQVVKTYTVGFTVNHPLLSETATNGQGDYVTAANSSALATALQDTFNSIFAQVQGSFTSAVVPGATIGLGNAFYNSYFKSSDQPVWEGHLEALRISQTGQIQDCQNPPQPAVDATTGDLLSTRVACWDAATELKTNTSRTIYTTKAGARVTFDNTNVDSTDLAVTSPTYANYPNYPASNVDTVTELVDAIIGYVRGKDAFDEDGDSDVTEMRPVVMGDIFHSTPRAIAAPTRYLVTEPGYAGFLSDYGDRDRVIYAGANDGVLHAFEAGQFTIGDDPATPTVESRYYTPGTGAERFGYVPGVQLDRMKLLPQNSPRSEYFVDGPISVADAWVGDGTGSDITKSTAEWATVMIAGMREGGTGYLALDITDPGAASGDDHFPYPKLLWEFTDADLGQSWSEPVIARVKLRNSFGSGDHCGPDDFDGDCREQWVAIFAGGYEADGDPNRPASYQGPADPGWNTTTKALYMVRLDTGGVVAKVTYDATSNPDMKFSIPSAPAVLDLNFDGFVDVVYVGDLGGQVWKWDISAVGEDTDADTLVDNWPSGVFFRTAPATLSSGDDHYRSFFYPPVASYVKGKLLLAFGSGERHDLGYTGEAGVADENRFYVAKDVNPIGASAFSTLLTDSDLTDVTALDTDTVSTDAGYRFDLAENEKFVTETTVFAGYVIVGSYTPDTGGDLCATSSGQSFLHIFNLATGLGFFPDPTAPPSEDRRVYVGGGFPTSPEVTVADNPDDDVIIIKTSEGPRVITIDAPPRNDPSGQFIYWKQQL